MKKLMFGAFAALALCAGSMQAQQRGNAPVDNIGLKDAYKDYFRVGVAINNSNLIPAEAAIITREFNSVTAENAFKPGEVHPAEGVWRWEGADSIANFCREHGLMLRGHNLLWHTNQGANWMLYDKKGKFVKKEVFYARLKDHIQTIMNRYKDLCYCWDVVNEAIADVQRPGDSPYRQSDYYKLCGDEFIAKAFEFAHEVDPNAILFYNDYNECDPGKRDRIYDMVKKMKDAGVPIHGIGMQGHYNIYGPSMEDVEAAIEKYASIVDHIHVTELDIRANQEMGGQLQFSRQGQELKPYIKIMHTKMYSQLFKTFRKYSDKIDVVTFWNLTDRDSWVGTANYPLLIDKDLNRKDGYYAVRDFDPTYDNVVVKEDFVPSETCQPGRTYPQVNSQGYARFQVDAPGAKSVITTIGKNGGTVLHKNAEGLWVGTTDRPEDDGFHYYTLLIDGASVIDPGTENYYGGARWSSGLEVPTNADKDFYAMKNVEHGNLQEVIFWSESTKQHRKAIVYTPAGYGKVGKKGKVEKYPVLYLQHGWGEQLSSWAVQGKTGLIMDNLIADGKIKPFIVVMTYGMTNEASRQDPNRRQNVTEAFQTVLVDELVPYIDAHFNTIADRDHRAMAGLSMGGMETHGITLARPEVFAYWNILSGGVYTPEEIGKLPKEMQPKLMFLNCGSKETPDRINKAVADLTAAGYNAVGHVSEGTAHEFLTWRRGLYELAQLIFK